MDTSTTGSQSLLPGVNVLLEGPTGTGKTHSIGTLVDTGIETYYLALESGLESLYYWTDKGKEVPSNLHWHHISHADSNFDVMLKLPKPSTCLQTEAWPKCRTWTKESTTHLSRSSRLSTTSKTSIPTPNTGSRKYGGQTSACDRCTHRFEHGCYVAGCRQEAYKELKWIGA